MRDGHTGLGLSPHKSQHKHTGRMCTTFHRNFITHDGTKLDLLIVHLSLTVPSIVPI